MNKFKVGDKVRRVSDGWEDMPLDSVWTVEYVPNDEEIRLVGTRIDWLSEYFELVSDEDVLKRTLMSSGDGGVIKCEVVDKRLYSPLSVQQAGDHYKKRGIQPIEYGLANNLSFPQINIVKYVTRHEDKNGLDDLAKSIHYHFFEALRVYGEDVS